MTMTTLRPFIAFFVLTGMAALHARTGDAMADHHAATRRQILAGYETVRAALADDDLAAAKTAVQKLATDADRLHHAGIASSAKAVARADNLAGAREAFKTLSVEVVALAKHTKGYFILTCPMAQADWVQSTQQVANPYLGKDMLTCGEVKEETKG
jgi:hypothetical protein